MSERELKASKCLTAAAAAGDDDDDDDITHVTKAN